MDNRPFETSASSCDSQSHLVSSIGRGRDGSSYKLEIAEDSIDTTVIAAEAYDPDSRTWNQQWITENINGGHLECSYIVSENTSPPTFRLQFTYSRPGREEWQVLTHPVPFVPEGSDQATSAVSQVFVRTDTSGTYKGMIVYPSGADFDISPGSPWSVNLTFGIGGNVELPNLTNMRNILGWSVSQLRTWNNNTALGGIKTYIDNVKTSLKVRIDKLNNANREIPIRMYGSFGAESGLYRTYSTTNNTFKLFPIGSNFKMLWGNQSDSLKKSEMQIIIYQEVSDSTHQAIAKTPNYTRANAGLYRPLPPAGAAELVYGTTRTHIDGVTFAGVFAVSRDRGSKNFWIYNPTDKIISLTVQCNSLFCFPDMIHPVSAWLYPQGMSRGPSISGGNTFHLRPHCMICSTDGLGFIMEEDTIRLNGSILATVHAPAADI